MEIKMDLPKDFISEIEDILGEESASFFESYEKRPRKALRLRGSRKNDTVLHKLVEGLSKVPWEERGYYYDGEASVGDPEGGIGMGAGVGDGPIGGALTDPGKDPLHRAGAYYIQEPSAMAPAALLIKLLCERNEPLRILDLCSAPGGKGTSLGEAFAGRGFVTCNEIHRGRAEILSENVERMGLSNVLVISEDPSRLSERFQGYFHGILVDAPCSGEGMFRKDSDAVSQWSRDNVLMCAKRQEEILDFAAPMLAPGGVLVYSTCTFSGEENEGSIQRLLKDNDRLEILDPVEICRMIDIPGADVRSYGIRLWPHRVAGEGHFLAAVRDKDYAGASPGQGFAVSNPAAPTYKDRLSDKSLTDLCREAAGFEAVKLPPGKLLSFGDQLYLSPPDMPDIRGLKVLRPGLHLGTLKKGRFIPSHALALWLSPGDFPAIVDLGEDTASALKYQRGETLNIEDTKLKGWALICCRGFSLGWGKVVSGVVKNHYPKGLREH